jgi:pilus assembly protein CpaC
MIGALFLTALTAALAAEVGAQVRPMTGAAPDRVLRFEVTVGKSQVIDFREAVTKVSVTNPAVADVFVATPNQILVNGKTPGVTSLVVFYPDRTQYFDIVVQADVALVRDGLRRVAPKSGIEVQPARDSIVLTGWVPSEEQVKQAQQVAEAFAPGKIVNLLHVVDMQPQQVLLQVHVAEVDRKHLNEFGVSWSAIGSSFIGGAFPGATFLPGISPSGGNIQPTPSDPLARPNFAFTDLMSFFLGTGRRDVVGVVRALAERDLLRTLAKPNLITLSGKEAKFLSGGEFPYPVPSGGFATNQITIEFKPFGVQLAFTPIVREDQTITLKVSPEVSSLDFSQGLQLQGFNIPVIRSNRAGATLELKDGESFAMAGMVNTTVRQNVSKTPFLGDIPILGALFRSTQFQNDETELLFLVTVKLVKPSAPGEGPDPARLMELQPNESNPYTGNSTMVPGLPEVGTVVERPFGESYLPATKSTR